MTWQAWAIQGAVLTVASVVAAAGTSLGSINDDRIARLGWPISIVIFATAAASFIVAGWTAPWSNA